MQYKWVTISIIWAATAFSGCGCGVRYVPYVPVDVNWGRGQPAFVRAPDLLTATNVEAMQILLFRSGCSFQVRDGVLYIPENLQKDEELLFNFQEKAADFMRQGHNVAMPAG